MRRDETTGAAASTCHSCPAASNGLISAVGYRRTPPRCQGIASSRFFSDGSPSTMHPSTDGVDAVQPVTRRDQHLRTRVVRCMVSVWHD